MRRRACGNRRVIEVKPRLRELIPAKLVLEMHGLEVVCERAHVLQGVSTRSPGVVRQPDDRRATVESKVPEPAGCSALTAFERPVVVRFEVRFALPLRIAEAPTATNIASISISARSTAAVPAPQVKVSRAVSPIAPAVPTRTMMIGVAVPAPVLETMKRQW